MAYRFDRAYYRLVYPLAHRPKLRVGNETYLVADLSEQGIRFIKAGPDLPERGTPMSGTLLLPTGDSLEIEGEVVRVDPPSVALLLSRGVPFGLMLDQQRFLQKRVVSWR